MSTCCYHGAHRLTVMAGGECPWVGPCFSYSFSCSYSSSPCSSSCPSSSCSSPSCSSSCSSCCIQASFAQGVKCQSLLQGAAGLNQSQLVSTGSSGFHLHFICFHFLPLVAKLISFFVNRGASFKENYFTLISKGRSLCSSCLMLHHLKRIKTIHYQRIWLHLWPANFI